MGNRNNNGGYYNPGGDPYYQGNNRRGDYTGNPPRDNGYYQNNYGPATSAFGFNLFEKVRHVHYGNEMIIIKFGREQIECRTSDMAAHYFYPSELERVTE